MEEWLSANSAHLSVAGSPEHPDEILVNETSEFPIYRILNLIGYRNDARRDYRNYDLSQMMKTLEIKMLPKDGGVFYQQK